ncbi:MAG: hypothetical protein WBG50_28655 [Desulfomonilaceae bacterium]
MTTNNTTIEPSVEVDLILRYLLTKCDDEKPFGVVFLTLALGVVSDDTELIEGFRSIISSVSTEDKRLGLFIEVITRTLTRVSQRDLPDLPSEDRPPDPHLSRQFSWEAWTLARRMLETECYEMLPLWRMLCWIGLQVDDQLRQEFAERCLQTDTEPAEQVEVGKDLIKQVLYKRRGSRRALSIHLRAADTKITEETDNV